MSEENSEIAKDAVMLLIREGYFFEAKLPLAVFQSINSFLMVPINPFYIQQALNNFCPVGEETLLKRIGGRGIPYYYVGV